MFDAIMRHLPYPLDRASNLEVQVPEDTEVCGVPTFPEDSDEKITVLFRLSLNDFVALATAIDVGSDIAYGDDGLKVWYLWVASVMCAQFCEEMAQCLTTENPAVVAALAQIIQSNQEIITAISNAITNGGGGIPGQPLSESQAASDTLPANVRDDEGECVLNNLWGACLFLVQSGNRAITDFFEQIEVASNTLETSAIVSQAIPAAGPYVSAAADFADQLQENLSEGYAGAYTEAYEDELACALFCLARENCQLTPDMLITVMTDRLGYVSGAENFGVVMARVGTGVFVGSAIADSAFYIYFTALRFGQQFGDIVGFRPLTDLMSLGADQLSSDNWTVLCECPETCVEPSFRVVNPLGFSGGTIELTDNMDGTWTLVGTAAFDTNGNRLAFVEESVGCCWETISLDFDTDPDNLNVQYNCGANPTDEDYGNGEGTGPLTPGLCGAGMVSSDVDEPFSVAWTFRAC